MNDALLKLIDALRDRGAVDVEVPFDGGVVKARFYSPVTVPSATAEVKPKSAAEIEAEHEAILYGSTS